MKTIAIPGLTLMVLAPFLGEDPAPQETTPPDEWLQALVGEWRAEDSAASADDGETERPRASESNRSIGGYWVVSEGTVPAGAVPITYLRTLGYDPRTESFVGTWIDSTSRHLWVYESGTLSDDGKTLTLESEGPGFAGGTSRYREVIALDGPDRRVHENLVQGADGTWTAFEKSVYVRAE